MPSSPSSKNLAVIPSPPEEEQRLFKKRMQQVEKLQREQEKISEKLDSCLHFYYGKIRPVEEKICDLLIQRIELTYHSYQKRTMLSRMEKKRLKRLIIHDLKQVLSLRRVEDLSPETKKILDALAPLKKKSSAATFLRRAKKMIQDLFHNIDLNFSEDKEAETQSASSSETEEERQKRMLQEMQKKSITSLYRQLVKTLHPDLEQNPEQKTWKESLMKEITAAYENGDLPSLLRLEAKALHRPGSKDFMPTADDLIVYNSILAEQIISLKKEKETLVHSPRYTPLHPFFRKAESLKEGERQLHQFLHRATKAAADLAEQLNKLYKESGEDSSKQSTQTP